MKNKYRGIWRESEWDRPFSVRAVAPSGRQPWPIKSGRGNYVEGRPVEVKFTYPVEHVPFGKRNPVVVRVEGRASVLFTAAEPSQVEVACRIVRPVSGRDLTEVVHFGRELWWSLPKQLTIQSFVAALAEGEHSAVGLLDRTSVSTSKAAASKAELNGKIIGDGHDRCVVGLQRGAESILVSDGRVFVRDGAPLYVLWNGYRNQSITGVGTSAVVSELASSRRNPAFEDVSNGLIFGRLFEAAEYAAILKFAKEKGITFEVGAKIELMLPELLRQDPIKVQLDATLRKLLRLLSLKRAGTDAGADEIRVERRRLLNVFEDEISAPDRGRALMSFLKWTEADPQDWRKKFRVEKLFVCDAVDRIEAECARRGYCSPFHRPLLSNEDDAAISALVG